MSNPKVVQFSESGSGPEYKRTYVLDNGQVWVFAGGDWGREMLPPPCVADPGQSAQLSNSELVTVRREDLFMAADGFARTIKDYESRCDGDTKRLASYSVNREALARLRAALEGK